MSHRLPRPCALHAPAAVMVGLGIMLSVLARTTGSGWLVVIASGLVPLLVLGALAPAIPLLRARPALRAPRDGVVGRRLLVRVSVDGHAPSLLLRVLEPASDRVRVDAPGRGDVAAVPSRRGVFHQLVVELRSAAPFGLVSWRRRVPIVLDRPLGVGPSPNTARARSRATDPEQAGERGTAARGVEMVRGVRGYHTGDALRLVHWPATARWGTVMVRELEDQARPRLVVVVDLRAPAGAHADAVEAVASDAAGVVLDAWADGRPVLLATAEAAGPVLAPVASPVDASRRLARAVPGVPAEPPLGSGDGIVRLGVGRGVP